MSKNEKFILSPISLILAESVAASKGVGDGIESYPVCDYIIQSVFLKMTGFQEQKLKCISWEIATNDFEYRFKFKSKYYSKYDEKNELYLELINQIEKLDSDFSIKEYDEERLINDALNETKEIFCYSNLSVLMHKSYNTFCKWSKNKDDNILYNKQKIELFKSGKISKEAGFLLNEYEFMYRERNRIAHNARAYQQNLPKLDELADEKVYARNYFLWFFILILIDTIFIELYKNYKCLLARQAW